MLSERMQQPLVQQFHQYRKELSDQEPAKVTMTFISELQTSVCMSTYRITQLLIQHHESQLKKRTRWFPYKQRCKNLYKGWTSTIGNAT